MIKISFVNKSSQFTDAELKTVANALQVQVSRDFYPIWGVQAQLYYTPTKSNPTADHWVIGIFDDADAADALGYHDVTPAGMPLGKVFVRPTLAQGSKVSATMSHELLEMLCDPDINLTAEFDDSSGRPSKFYAYEVCDSPEDDQFGYLISGVTVSDFVTPAWFESFNKVGPYDFMNKITKPFEILPGGYIGYLDMSNLAAGWQQQLGRLDVNAIDRTPQGRMSMETRAAAARPRKDSRRTRRGIPRNQWITSQYSPSDIPGVPVDES